MEDADRIRAAIRDIIEEEDYKDMMVGDLILLAEVTGSSGAMEMITIHNIEMARWKELGMLHNRIMSISEGGFVLGVVEEEEDED